MPGHLAVASAPIEDLASLANLAKSVMLVLLRPIYSLFLVVCLSTSAWKIAFVLSLLSREELVCPLIVSNVLEPVKIELELKLDRTNLEQIFNIRENRATL